TEPRGRVSRYRLHARKRDQSGRSDTDPHAHLYPATHHHAYTVRHARPGSDAHAHADSFGDRHARSRHAADRDALSHTAADAAARHPLSATNSHEKRKCGYTGIGTAKGGNADDGEPTDRH